MSKLPGSIYKVPNIAWPTLAVLAGIWFVLAGAFAMGASGLIPMPLAVLAATAAAYAAFTPMHDAAHGSVSRRKEINEPVGRAAAAVLSGPFIVFRYMHLEHHRFTNEPERDPDFLALLQNDGIRPESPFEPDHGQFAVNG